MGQSRQDLAASANALRALHRPGEPLILPNAWDVASAQVVQNAGFPAIATTSGGVAAAMGYEDGEVIPAEEMLRAVGRIAAAVPLPVTADLEAGYGMPPEVLVAALLEAGAVGMNYEDTDHNSGELRPVAQQAAKIAAIKDAARAAGVDVVLNARIDVYLRGDEEPKRRLDEALVRALAYRDAGADSIFPIFCSDPEHISVLVRETGAPINVYARKGLPPIARLAELGVARISFGGGLMRSAMKAAAQSVAGILAGRYPWE